MWLSRRIICVSSPAGAAHCPRWKARGPDWRPSVRHAVAWPLVLTRLSLAALVAAAGCARLAAPSPPLRGGENPLKALQPTRFFRSAKKARRLPGSVRPASRASLRGSFASLTHPFQGVLAADFVGVSGGGLRPPALGSARLGAPISASRCPLFVSRFALDFVRCPHAEIPTCGSPRRRGSRLRRDVSPPETGCFARAQLLEGWNEVLLKFARTTTDPAFEGHFLLSTADDLHHGLPQIRWTRLPWDE